ncbi:MAG: PocR ligand-binding domain-containing protein [Desulfobacteraceae bacterium]|nr:PocR ligand-binding domain-containing protein [Desulfobacteraceae bacterium]
MTTHDNRPAGTLSLEETRQLILDLQARQASLEAENEALRRALAENALRENTEKLHAIIQGSPIPAFAIGKDHKIVHWNKALVKLSGVKAEKVIGTRQQWRAFYSEERPCLADLLVDDAIDVLADWYSGKYIRSELIADAYEATDFFPALGEGGKWLRFTAAAVRDAHGEIAGAVETLEDVTDRKQAEELLRSKIVAQRTLAEANLHIEYMLNTLREKDAAVRNKLNSIFEPEGDIGALDLSDIIDSEALQSMMEDFYRITRIGIAIIDVSGKILVAVGWQDICAKFHRPHPDALKNCLESDIVLTKGVPAGTFKAYRCKNNMWDMATPIEVGGRHLGNIHFGQFFYDDEVPDEDLFRGQARKYGFDETEYLAALSRVPRWSRETVDAAMMFYAKLAGIISTLGHSTIRLSRTLAEQRRTEEKPREKP